MEDKSNETAFFKACEIGDIANAKEMLKRVDMSILGRKQIPEGRTCLHVAVIAEDAGFFRELVENLEMKAGLFDCENKDGETPLMMAVRLGFVEAVELLMTRTSNALHFIVELNQVKLADRLREKVDLSKLINQPYKPITTAQPEKKPSNPSGDEGNRATSTQQGDTTLHIAASNKYEHMVNLLLKVDKVKKRVCNSEGKTPLAIAREVTDYHESFRIIGKLSDYPPKGRPFMYCAPQVSNEKHKRAKEIVNKAFDDRRNSELVVAALLATMTFTAVFTVPGGFETERKQTKVGKVKGLGISWHGG